jgi:hypothetical protein
MEGKKMKIKSFMQILSLIFLIISITAISYAKVDNISSTWTDTPMKIDGLDDEWVESTMAFQKKMQVDYAFKNDAEYLYVLFKFKNLGYLSSINYTGMTLWLDAEGKKKKHYGIKFSNKEVTVDEYIALLEEKQGPLSEEQKTKLRLNQSYLIANPEVVNKKSSDQPAAIKDSRPAKYDVKVQENSVVFEFSIPLERPAESAPGIGTEPGKNIKVGFEWGGVTKDIEKAMMKGPEGQRPLNTPQKGMISAGSDSGKGGGGGGALGGGGMLSNIRSLRRMYKQYIFWTDVKLAEK